MIIIIIGSKDPKG